MGGHGSHGVRTIAEPTVSMTNNKVIRHIIRICCWAVFLTCSATIVSCSHSDGPSGKKKSNRVVVVYMVAENSLASSQLDTEDIKEMLSGKNLIPDGDHLIIYHDGTSLPSLYDVTRKTKANIVSELSPVKSWDEDVNSASVETLNEVLQYVYGKYPAESYGLVMWSHGAGWMVYEPLNTNAPSRNPKTSFGIDNGNNTVTNAGARMNIKDMAQTLSQFGNIEYIMFDACFMQEIEVAYELRNVTSYIIGSPAEIPGEGAPYKHIMSSLFSHTSPADIAFSYFNYFDTRIYKSGVVLSTVKTDELEHFADLMKELLVKYNVADVETHGLFNYFEYDYYRNYQEMPDLYDMKGVMQRLLSPEDYDRWLTEFNKLVVGTYASDSWYTEFGRYDCRVDHEQCGGITMYIPLSKYRLEKFDKHYCNTAWAQRMATH